MNKKAIWAIIGLMSAAVIGVVWLQMDLISTAIEVNEEEFDKNVYNALNAVGLRLEYEEKKEAFKYSINGYVVSHFQIGTQNSNNLSLDLPQKEFNSNLKKPGFGTHLDRLMEEITDACTCSRCLRERDNDIRRLLVYNMQGTNNIPLEERIKLDHLNTVLEQELTNRGIDTEYNYGIYAKNKKNFVIVDGHYMIDEEQPRSAVPGFKNIYNSKYRIELFKEELPPPGLLMIHFPSRTSFVWRSLWLNFLGSILFTALILFCFAYTINVIFQQKKLSEMKTDFINNMTHEFKTPIATISLAADSITSPMISGNADKVHRFASIIKQENKRMNKQVEKVLQMALIDKQEYNLKWTQVNLHEVIERAVENITLQVEKKDGIVNAYLEATNPYIEADLTHISNVINNLLDNANKYSPEQPEISIYTRNVNDGVEVIVEDKGIGMSKEARKHIFDKFYRVHTGNLHDVKGFGLGLSYVKAMVTAHKGQVDVKSELGKGSSFILFFPAQVTAKNNS